MKLKSLTASARGGKFKIHYYEGSGLFLAGENNFDLSFRPERLAYPRPKE
jgi:hypothetical protein